MVLLPSHFSTFDLSRLLVAVATSGVVIFHKARVANRFRYDTQAGSQDAIRAYNR